MSACHLHGLGHGGRKLIVATTVICQLDKAWA